jgi:hypothetical protein
MENLATFGCCTASNVEKEIATTKALKTSWSTLRVAGVPSVLCIFSFYLVVTRRRRERESIPRVDSSLEV